MRLIDADKLLQDIEHYNLSDGKFQHWVEIQPTIEIEQKKGEWELCTDDRFDIDYYKCSECGYEPYRRMDISNFCPGCGADMRGE